MTGAEFIAWAVIALVSAGFIVLVLFSDGFNDTDKYIVLGVYFVAGLVLVWLLKVPIAAFDPKAAARANSIDDAVGFVAFLPFDWIDKAFNDDGFSGRSMFSGFVGGAIGKTLWWLDRRKRPA